MNNNQRLYSDATHEIRSLLTVLKTQTQLVQKGFVGNSPEEIQSYVKKTLTYINSLIYYEDMINEWWKISHHYLPKPNDQVELNTLLGIKDNKQIVILANGESLKKAFSYFYDFLQKYDIPENSRQIKVAANSKSVEIIISLKEISPVLITILHTYVTNTHNQIGTSDKWQWELYLFILLIQYNQGKILYTSTPKLNTISILFKPLSLRY